VLACFVSGFGPGFVQQFYVAAQLHITPVQDRSENTHWLVFSSMLAVGLGPMVVVTLQLPDTAHDAVRNFTHTGFTQLVILLGAMVAASLYHPKLDDIQDCMEEKLDAGLGEAAKATGCYLLICGCLLLAWFRAFGVASLEVAMTSLLEGHY